MTHPVERSQNIFTHAIYLHQATPSKQSTMMIHDTMKMGEYRQRSTLGSIWDSIVKCFKSLFSSFFGSNADQKTQIQDIAARDHFVWFYKQEENPLTAFMGNFHLCPIQIWGLNFKCTEAAFQAAKFSPDRSTMLRFQNLDGDAAFRLGRQLAHGSNAAAWRARSLNVMREVVNAKFAQNPALKDLLLATGTAYLVEHIPVKNRDAFWGDDSDGTGQNWLGKVMMETRANLGGAAPAQRNQQYDHFLSNGQ